MGKRLHSVLLVPPAPPGSFGDEAIIIGSINYLLEHGTSRIGLVSHLKPERKQHPALPIEFIDCSDYFEKKDDNAVYGLERALEEYDACLFFGADMLDGYYSLQTSLRRLKLVLMAAGSVVPTAIVGFSFNKYPRQEAVDLFRELGPRVNYCLRDKVSKSRFERATGLSAILTADPAFLLDPYRSGQLYREIQRFRRQNHRKGHRIIGINPNYMPSLKSEDISLVDFKDFHLRLITRLMDELNCSIVLFPHDIRGSSSDLVLCRQIAHSIPREEQNRVFTAAPEKGAAEIKGIAGLFDFALCQRMHAAIACLGQGVPCFCVTYQDKFEGLLDHFGFTGLSMDREEAFGGDALFNRLNKAIDEKDNLKIGITKELPEITFLAERNFEYPTYPDR